jgi:hypothetical protein
MMVSGPRQGRLSWPASHDPSPSDLGTVMAPVTDSDESESVASDSKRPDRRVPGRLGVLAWAPPLGSRPV